MRYCDREKRRLLSAVAALLVGNLSCLLPIVSAQTNNDNDASCSLCEDGSPLPQPGKEIIPDIDGTMQTCTELEAVANEASSTTCPSFQGVYGVYCGCNNPVASENACHICGGSNPLPDPSLTTLLLGKENSTEMISCGAIEFAATAFSESFRCDEAQVRYSTQCCQEAGGDTNDNMPTRAPTDASPIASTLIPTITATAESAPPTRGTCTLCEDGSPLPQPDKEIIPDIDGTMQTCTELETVANEASSTMCPYYQGVYGVYCGCNNPVASENACHICGGSNPLPDPSLTTLLLGKENSTEMISCGAIEFSATAFSESFRCDDAQVSYSTQCCQEAGGDTNDNMPTRAPTDASPIASTLVPTITATTESPPPDSASCTLCEDGSPLPQPDKEIIPDIDETMQTCAEIEANANEANSTMCPYFQGVYGVYCGCNNPIASEKACRICGDNMPLPDPSLETLFLGRENSTEMISCGALEFAATAFPKSLPCVVAQDRYKTQCCQGAEESNSNTPTREPSGASPIDPTAVPSVTPTTESAPTSTTPATSGFALRKTSSFAALIMILLSVILW